MIGGTYDVLEIAQASLTNNLMCGVRLEPRGFDTWSADDKQKFYAEVNRLADERRMASDRISARFRG